jgi:hypothetical protein
MGKYYIEGQNNFSYAKQKFFFRIGEVRLFCLGRERELKISHFKIPQ